MLYPCVFTELTVGKVNEHVSELHDWLAPLKRIGPTFLSDAPTVMELVTQIRQYSDEVADMPKGLVTVVRILQYIAVAPSMSEVGRELSSCLFTQSLKSISSSSHSIHRVPKLATPLASNMLNSV